MPLYFVCIRQGLGSNGVKVVGYSYDAWGRLLTTTGTLSSTLGLHNPLRYRGYVYDRETGLYYLQSRYYNPEIGRFINADSLVSTGQGVLGYNMFAYCGNNPINRVDSTGMFWEELWNAFVETLRQLRGYFAFSAGVSQIDSPGLGPADLVALGLVATGVVLCMGNAVYAVLSNKSVVTTVKPLVLDDSSDEIKKIQDTAREYTIYECEVAAQAMKKQNRDRGNIVCLEFQYAYNGYVISDKNSSMAISLNGKHYGYMYNEIVYCNIYPDGRPFDLWVNSFHDASGQPPVIKIY